jgi:transposase
MGMRLYPPLAVEWAMKRQEVILKAIDGQISWIVAAHVLRMTPRNLRRLKRRYERDGYDGLLDGRRGRPSPKRAPVEEVKRILRLYRETYAGFNMRHFHETMVEKHQVKLSYTFVRKLLEEAGLVQKKRKRGVHRKRRERRASFGEMIHIDGSEHAWLALLPDEKQTLIAVADDATGKILYAQLWGSESTYSIMAALEEVIRREGIPMALYSDRAGWAFETPKAGEKVDPTTLTHVGRALARLGVEHIPAYSPQARGRSERLNGILQDRLINELRVAGIKTLEKANQYLRKRFIPHYNRRFAKPPACAQSAFVSAHNVDLNQIFCVYVQRRVAQDNTVLINHLRLQIEKQPGRPTCAGLHVQVRRHLNGHRSLWQGLRCLGIYDAQGKPLSKKPKGIEAATALRATPSAPLPLLPLQPREVQRTGHFMC